MAYIFLFLLLLNTSLLFSKIFDNKVEQNLFISIFIYIFILFVFGLVNSLHIGFITILIVNIGILIYNIYVIKQKKLEIKNIITFGFLLFVICYLIVIWLSHGRIASVWDEYSHWAIVVKNMFNLNNFGLGPDSTVLFKSYLSGTSIFQYFCVKLSGNFNESMLYLGMNTMILSTIIPIFSHLEQKRNLFYYILAMFILLIPSCFYPEIYNSLYVDGILGLTFAYSLYSYFNNREKKLNKFDIVNLAVSYGMLVFIKDFGFFLALISFAMMLIDYLCIRNKFTLKNIVKNNYQMLLTILPALAIKFVWMLILKLNHVTNIWKLDTGSSIRNIITLNFAPYQKETIFSFLDAIFNTSLSQTNISITPLIALFIFIIIGYVLIRSSQKEKVMTSKFISTSVFLGAFVYGGLLLIAYITVFSEYEAVRLASFERYIGTYALGGIITLLALLINNLSSDKNKLDLLVIIMIIIFIVNYDFKYLGDITLHARGNVNYSKTVREPYQEFLKKVDKNLTKNDHLYFISTNDNGLDFYTAKYEITPIKLNGDGWSIGEPYYDGDIWTKKISADEWRVELLENYAYVYLYDIDDEFITQYGDLFITDNIKDNQLYRVLLQEEKAILEFVE